MKKVTTYDEQFFDVINTPEKAYFLGLMYADGSTWHIEKTGKFGNILYEYDTSISLQETDKSILERFKKALNWKHSLIYKPAVDSNHQASYMIRLCGKKLHDDLVKHGCVEKKSLILQFPKDLSPELISHFVRGYFDGDGCIWNGKRKKMWVKDLKCKVGYRERIVHNVKFHFTGCIDFISELQQYLIDNVGFKKNKLNVYHRDYQSDKNCLMEYSGRGNIKKLYDFMYKDCEDLYIKRKKEKFEEIICAFDEKSSKETRLIAGTPETVISSQAEINSEGSSTIPEMEVESSDSKCLALNE